jgi:hypothetical protein
MGGTIMSYCDVVPGVGILLSNGFGILPGNVIRATVAANTCTGTCPTTCNSNIIIDGANYIGSYYTQPLTESSTWIKTNGKVLISGGSVKLDADVSEYVELNEGFETKAVSSSSVFTAQVFDGCTTGAPNFTSKSDNPYSQQFKDRLVNEKANSFTVYPNPATDYFTLVSSNDLQDATIELFDMSGKLQTVMIQNTGKKSKKIMVKNLSKGMYMIKLATAEKTEFAKIIIL